MMFGWIPEVLKQLNKYSEARFWGILLVVTFITCLYLMKS